MKRIGESARGANITIRVIVNANNMSARRIIHALVLLAFTARLMVRSAHRVLFPIRFSAQFGFAVPDRYSYKKIHTASFGSADLNTRHHIKSLPVTFFNRNLASTDVIF